MSNRRDEFPATSIGRTAGNRLQNPSALSLDTHPLLSPRPASPTPSEPGTAHPRYLPYTPRQRVTPTAATTGTTVHPPPSSSSTQHHPTGDATSKLQLMHLKAAAQMIGLDSGTLGWAMLEKVVLDAEAGDQWSDVWNAITSGKVTLLLPLEASFNHEKVTPDFMKDHIALCDGLSRNNAQIVTLSGLRGSIEDETLTFRSSISTSSKSFQDLLTPSTRTSALSRLPPLPTPFPSIPISYPQYQLTTHTSSLHLPPRSQTSSKPPLPPRPGARAHPPSISASRIGNPFASLFGGGAKPTPQPPPSPPTSLRSFDSQTDSSVPIEVSAFAIDRRILRKDISKEINKGLRSELKAAFKSGTQPLPRWVTERIHELTADWYPFLNARSNGPHKRDSGSTSNKDATTQSYEINSIDENLEDTSERIQDFFTLLEQDLRLSGGPAGSSRRSDKESVSDVEGVGEESNIETETKIRETLEVVERLITWLFYERLFCQPTTDDSSHDEALSNRIAALNLLDLGLEHLGIDIGEVNEPDLNAVVKACGEMLSQLDSCRCPADKAAVLVAAHKIVVDGLERLPPVRLISEDEAKSKEKDDDVHLTEKPTSSFTSTPTLTDGTELTTPDSVLNSSKSLDGHSSMSANKQTNPIVESKTKPVPPPLNLDSPRLQVHLPLKEPTPVSGDVLFPLIIFSVVKANPSHLVSNLLFTQRFRNQSIGGEESYCLINMMAVAEFLENVDMAALGLDNTDKVLSTADLTPILPSRSPVTTEASLPPSDGAVAAIRGRVEQQVDAIADSANKVISGVVDSSFGILRSFMPSGGTAQSTRGTSSGRTTPGTPGRASFGLLRRESGFSIASLAASLPIAGRSRLAGGSSGGGEEAGQQMISVSRPGSRSPRVMAKPYEVDDDDEEGDEEGESVSSKDESEDDEGDKGEPDVEPEVLSGDGKRIRSFESMLSSANKERQKSPVVDGQQQPRKTLSDRLASVSAFATSTLKGSPPESRPSSTYASHQRSKSAMSAVSSSRPESPDVHATTAATATATQRLRLAPPKERFMECTVDELKLSEIGELLREYRRLADGIRAAGGFDE